MLHAYDLKKNSNLFRVFPRVVSSLLARVFVLCCRSGKHEEAPGRETRVGRAQAQTTRLQTELQGFQNNK